MSILTQPVAVVYPDDDGNPMSDNTVQFRLILRIYGNLSTLFDPDPSVFVGGNLLWYPVEGNNRIRNAPDVMVVFGRPKGDRGSYQQWLEGGVAPQVVFEILSPGNRIDEMERKILFYQRHGVEEYYQIDPRDESLLVLRREGDRLVEVDYGTEWVSPRLGIKFTTDGGLRLWLPDGRPFLSFEELAEQNRSAEARADDEQARADDEQARADDEQARADDAEARAERLAAKLRELGIDPETLR